MSVVMWTIHGTGSVAVARARACRAKFWPGLEASHPGWVGAESLWLGGCVS